MRGKPGPPPTIEQIFSDTYSELDDWDVVLVEDRGPGFSGDLDMHQCQLVSYVWRAKSGFAPSTEDLVQFIEKRKMKRAPADLRLVIHIEEESDFTFDWVPLTAHFQMRKPPCPYQQVFLLAMIPENGVLGWSCRQLYPIHVPMRTLTVDDAKALVLARAQDRANYVRPSGS